MVETAAAAIPAGVIAAALGKLLGKFTLEPVAPAILHAQRKRIGQEHLEYFRCQFRRTHAIEAELLGGIKVHFETLNFIHYTPAGRRGRT